MAQKFVSEGDITAVIGDFSSTACLAAAPIYQRAGVIMITPVAFIRISPKPVIISFATRRLRAPNAVP